MTHSEKKVRRQMLERHGIEDGSVVPVWTRRRRTGKPNGRFITCFDCRERAYVPDAEEPGRCQRETCRREFNHGRRPHKAL